MKIWGDGSESSICIRLGSANSTSVSVNDYVITVDFIGEREFVLIETDNGEYSTTLFNEKTDETSYAVYRELMNYSQIDYMNIYTSGGCGGIRIGDIRAVKHIAKTLVNPTVAVGNQSITFSCEIKSGSYLEYVDGIATIYDVFGYKTEVQSVIGSIVVPNGVFTAKLLGSEGNRAKLTFGLYGDPIS